MSAARARPGVAALLREPPRPGKAARLTPAAWAGLEAAMGAGEIATLAQAQRYLAEQWGIRYTLAGISWQCQRRHVKRKTGRRRHRRADVAQQEAFKKTSARR